MTLSEKAAYAWIRWSDDARFGCCQDCERVRDDAGKRLIVRRRRSSHWLCLECWDQR